MSILPRIDNPFRSQGFYILLLIVLSVVVIGFIGVLEKRHPFITFSQLKPGQIVLSTYPLRLGESQKIRYRRELRSGSIAQPGKITAKWYCYEWVQSGQGSDRTITTHLLRETTLPSCSISPGTPWIRYEAQIEIPVDGPSSFDAGDNQVRWKLRLNVD